MAEKSNPSDIDIPEASKLLREAYEKSRYTVPELAELSGLSAATIHIAMQGYRYRKGVAHRSVPSNNVLISLGGVLRIDPSALRAIGHDSAADILAEAAGETRPTPSEREAQAVGYNALARKVLAAFTDEELSRELELRKQER